MGSCRGNHVKDMDEGNANMEGCGVVGEVRFFFGLCLSLLEG
jgi:hypothetical protein